MSTCSQLSKCDALYCATTALDGYPSHSDKIHYFQIVTSLYICSTAFYRPCQIITPILIIPPTDPLLPANICFCPSQATYKPHHQLIHNSHLSRLCVKRPWPNPVVPIILETRCGMWWKVRQWRF